MSLRALAPSQRDISHRQFGGRHSGANMSMERALRSISSPTKGAGLASPSKAIAKKGRNVEKGGEESVKGE